MKNTVAVVMGGFSPEFEVSLKSAEVVYRNLSKIKYEPYRVLISPEKWVALDDEGKEYPINRADFSFDKNGQRVAFDVVFNAIHGSPGEDGPLAGYFEMLKIPQTASGQFESALTFNKAECSLLLKQRGVVIPEAVYLRQGEDYNSEEILDKLGLPCFVKPNRSGSSIGVSKVKSEVELQAALDMAFAVDSRVVIERMIKGLEVGCGVSDHNGYISALACTDIEPVNEFFDYESKYSGRSREVTPARIDESTYQQIMEESEFIFRSLDLKGLTRVDYIVNEHGVPFFIEVNTVPGLSAESILPKQAEYLGISLGELFDSSVAEALKRKK